MTKTWKYFQMISTLPHVHSMCMCVSHLDYRIEEKKNTMHKTRCVHPEPQAHIQNAANHLTFPKWWQLAKLRKLIKILLEWICQPEGACLVHTRTLIDTWTFLRHSRRRHHYIVVSIVFGFAHSKEWKATPRHRSHKWTWYSHRDPVHRMRREKTYKK